MRLDSISVYAPPVWSDRARSKRRSVSWQSPTRAHRSHQREAVAHLAILGPSESRGCTDSLPDSSRYESATTSRLARPNCPRSRTCGTSPRHSSPSTSRRTHHPNTWGSLPYILLVVRLVQIGSTEPEEAHQHERESDQDHQRVGRYAETKSPRWAKSPGWRLTLTR